MNNQFERFAAWQEAINLDLLNAAINLVLSSSMCSDDVAALTKALKGQPWFNAKSAQSYFSSLGIRYMGELLERHAEKFGAERRHYRAVALALALSLPCAEHSMFVGNQRQTFLKRLQEDAGDDLYLLLALYLLEPAKQTELLERILSSSSPDAAALLFALPFLPADTFTKLRPQFGSLLGKGRALCVFGNSGIYAALLRIGGETIRACRQRDNALLRALLSLCDGYVRTGSRPDVVLQEHGYTRLEICFLNVALLWEKHLMDSSPAEKLAVEFTVTALNSREKLSCTVLDLVRILLQKYTRFAIKIDGHAGLWEAITLKLHPDCPETVAWMAEHIDKPFAYRFDVLDRRWDVLATLIPEKYHALFRMQLGNADDTSLALIQNMLACYQHLTGKAYIDVFQSYTYEESDTFRVLVNAGVILLSEFFTAHEHDPDNANSRYSCMHYIQEYAAKVQTRTAYDFWVWFFSRFTVRDFPHHFGTHCSFHDHLLLSESHPYQRYYGVKPDIAREFLSLEEQRQLYEWVDESYFCFQPDRYASFQVQMLQNDLVRQMYTPEELRQIFDTLLAAQPQDVPNYLKQLYYTDEEKAREETEKNRRRAKEAQAALEKSRAEWTERIQKVFDGTFHSASRLADHAWRNPAILAELLLPVVLERYEACNHQLVHKEIVALAHLCAFFLEHTNTFLPTFKAIVAQLEEVTADDRSSSATDSVDDA